MRAARSVLLTSCLLSAIAVLPGCSNKSTPAPTAPGPTTPPQPQTLIAADSTGAIFKVDPATGTLTPLVTTTWDNGGGGGPVPLGRISSMLYVPATGKLWAGQGGNSSTACPGCVMTIDPMTGVADSLRDLSGPMRAVPGLALRSSDGAVFSTEADGSGFFTLDPVTAAATSINPTTPSGSGNGLTFGSNAVLYLASDEELYTVDPATGNSVNLGVRTYSGFPPFLQSNQRINSMTTRASDGAIFGILNDGGGNNRPGPFYLVTVNPSTLVVTHVAEFTRRMDGLAFVPETMFP